MAHITDDPLRIRYGGVDTYIDLAAERVIAAEKADQKIAVEVKSFLSDSTTYEFHLAVGQYVDYRILLSKTQPERRLYMAVPSDVYHGFFEGMFAQLILQEAQIHLLVYDSKREAIEQWIN
ncbi:FdxN element excision controlling factor protein [Candidatus Moduliflexus flocculans]|uniref:FdxN element excision controlling factor protein n=1 Tax=Candidatus Moduliflexus flocculans TaxID=1499966 RepID=A0A081BS26_9BACT|nr:FdxN element excision controlling factor protein [Candidatus Moduliflexus flocculans]